MKINFLISIYFVVSLACIIPGFILLAQNAEIDEITKTYDGAGSSSDCKITESNVGTNCSITFTFNKAVSGPLYLYYELTNFYQNDLRYVDSVSPRQMMGEVLTKDQVYDSCYPLVQFKDQLLYPCGLIANSLFNDIIKMDTTSPAGLSLDEYDISWPDDETVKFQQIEGFKYALVPSDNLTYSCMDLLGKETCSTYSEVVHSVTYNYYFWYPRDAETKYLYETFPDIISPIEGVQNLHFINWMRTAGLPNFRKLYGVIHHDFEIDDYVTFDLNLNFEVASFGGTKSLVLTSLAGIGAKNYAIGRVYLIVGFTSFALGVFFSLKRALRPRRLGDIRQLKWSV